MLSSLARMQLDSFVWHFCFSYCLPSIVQDGNTSSVAGAWLDVLRGIPCYGCSASVAFCGDLVMEARPADKNKYVGWKRYVIIFHPRRQCPIQHMSPCSLETCLPGGERCPGFIHQICYPPTWCLHHGARVELTGSPMSTDGAECEE